MKVGITGVAGMLGSHLSELLIEDGHDVIGVDDLSFGQKENLSLVIENKRFKFLNFDARDKMLLAIAFNECDFIVHLAAVKKIVESQVSFETLDVNVQTTKNVLDIARSTGAKVIFASTSDVYGVSESIPFKEDQDVVIGQSLAKRWSYAVSKLYAEHLCVGYNKDFGVDVVILRYFGGFSEKSALMWSGGHVPIFIGQILRGEEITIHGDGKQTRSMGHASDLAHGTYLAMQHINACSGEIINIGNDEEVSVLDTAYMLADELNLSQEEMKIKFIPEKEIYGAYKDLRRRRPDISKAKALLGYKPKLTLKAALRMVCDSYRKEF